MQSDDNQHRQDNETSQAESNNGLYMYNFSSCVYEDIPILRTKL